jgi:thiol-disulfide isomerase/thioredoxin
MKLHAAIGLIVAAVVGAMVFVFVEIGGSSPGKVRVGTRSAEACTEAAPRCLHGLTMLDRDGQSWLGPEQTGSVVVINVWATWCKPCKHELPALVALRNRYSEDDLILIGVLTDDPGEDVIDQFVERYGINYPIVPVTGAIDEALESPSGLPTTFVYDRSGRLVERKLGAVTLDGLAHIIDDL